MKETVAYCDLDDKDARRPGVAVLKIEVDGVTHVVDVCQVHLTLLSRLPTGVVTRGRRRGTRRAAKRVAAAPAAPAKRAAKQAAKKAAPARKRTAAKAPAKKATKAPAKRAAKATRGGVVGRQAGSRRDQQQRIAAAREWARAEGRAIADKGRLPAGLLEEFARASR